MSELYEIQFTGGTFYVAADGFLKASQMADAEMKRRNSDQDSDSSEMLIEKIERKGGAITDGVWVEDL